MKKPIFAILMVAAMSLPSAVLADDNTIFISQDTPSPQMQAAFQAMQQAHARVEQLHAQARNAMLNSLTPAHRSLLAEVVGQLAISPNPDVNAAGRTLDSALSPNESRSILGISSSLESQARQIMQAVHQQLMSAQPQGQAGQSQPQGEHMHAGWTGDGMREARPTDPGTILLLASLHAMEPQMMVHPGMGPMRP